MPSPFTNILFLKKKRKRKKKKEKEGSIIAHYVMSGRPQ